MLSKLEILKYYIIHRTAFFDNRSWQRRGQYQSSFVSIIDRGDLSSILHYGEPFCPLIFDQIIQWIYCRVKSIKLWRYFYKQSQSWRRKYWDVEIYLVKRSLSPMQHERCRSNSNQPIWQWFAFHRYEVEFLCVLNSRSPL